MRCARWCGRGSRVARSGRARRSPGDLRDAGFARARGGRLRAGVPRGRRLPAVGQGSARTVPLERGGHAATCWRRRGTPAWSAWSTPARWAASAFRADGIGDEDTPVTLDDMAGDYKRSKFLAEQVALEFARGGLAGGDRQSHGAGGRSRRQAHAHRQDRARLSERRHAGVHRYRAQRGGCAGRGRGALAGVRARAGGRAVHPGLGESDAGADSRRNWRRSPAAGRPPCGCLMPWLTCAGVCSTAWAGVTGTPPRVPLDAVRMARKKMWVTHEKASRELGFAPGPAEAALARAVEWFRAPANRTPHEDPAGGSRRDGISRRSAASGRSAARAVGRGLGAHGRLGGNECCWWPTAPAGNAPRRLPAQPSLTSRPMPWSARDFAARWMSSLRLAEVVVASEIRSGGPLPCGRGSDPVNDNRTRTV